MSFREKTAWVTLCAIVIVTLMYWFHVPSIFESDGWMLRAIGASLAAYVLIEVVGYLVLRLRYPQDAREPKDERERLIDLKALRIAYYVFVVASLGSMFTMLHVAGAGPSAVGLTVLMAFVLAQIAKHAARIVYYRRA